MTDELTPEDYLALATTQTPISDVDPLGHLDPADAATRRRRRRADHALALDLAALRTQLGVTQTALGEAMQRPQSNISRIERSAETIQLNTLLAYLTALGVHATLVVERDGATIELALA